MNLKYLLLGICILVIAEPAMALRCGNRIVTDGDHKSKILKHCGEPIAVQVTSVYRAGYPRQLSRHRLDSDNNDILLIADRAYAEVVVEEWTYNFGPRKLMRTIKFENGLVVAVRRLGYGFLE